jgi:hypothetical protein
MNINELRPVSRAREKQEEESEEDTHLVGEKQPEKDHNGQKAEIRKLCIILAFEGGQMPLSQKSTKKRSLSNFAI